jgi:hypothetical protein
MRGFAQQFIAGPPVTIVPQGMAVWFVDRPAGPVTNGIVGAPNIEGVVEDPIVVDGLGPGVPIIERDALGVGTTTKGLTPALPISTEPNGIPVRATLPDAVEDIAAIDEVLPLELAPQIAPLPAKAPIPSPIPPPSYVLTPDIPDEGLPIAEHVVPKPANPVVPSVRGLSPGDASSVAPKGIPVGGTDAPGTTPSGEVAAIPGIGLPIPST